ncbi:MAG TPA: DUF3565 domain-containing protein [Gemmatimonadales bacterium]|nr:DUF3565 domain-containing protein [Gemmatimonadales bacterium]
MDRRIKSFRQDDEGVWIADLECGHSQHVRHDPPWQVRPWVVEEATRRARIGTPLFCRLCSPQEAATRAYEEAKMCGLCDEGADEVAKPERNGRPSR